VSSCGVTNLKVANISLTLRLSDGLTVPRKSALPTRLPSARLRLIDVKFNVTSESTVPGVPTPTELLFISATLQLVAGQNPAHPCPKDRAHSKADIVRAIMTCPACAVALGKIVCIAYTLFLIFIPCCQIPALVQHISRFSTALQWQVAFTASKIWLKF